MRVLFAIYLDFSATLFRKLVFAIVLVSGCKLLFPVFSVELRRLLCIVFVRAWNLGDVSLKLLRELTVDGDEGGV